MGSGIMGAVGSHQQAQAQADYQNESARRNYEYANRQRALDWQNQLSVWAVKRNEYQQQVGENFSAADRAYASEQTRLNEQYEAAALQKQDMMAQLIGLTGTNNASERSGRSVQRLDTAALAAFGRNNAIISKNLTSARSAMIQRTYDNTLQLDAANRRAYSNVAVAPTAGIAPPQPVMVAGPSGMGLAAGILGGVASGIGAFNSLKAPDAGGPAGGNSWGYGQTGGMKTFGSELFTPKTNFSNSYKLPTNGFSWDTSKNWIL
jgi:hypothetical protein